MTNTVQGSTKPHLALSSVYVGATRVEAREGGEATQSRWNRTLGKRLKTLEIREQGPCIRPSHLGGSNPLFLAQTATDDTCNNGRGT